MGESNEKYHRLFELVSDAIFFVDNATGRILDTNSAASAIYGYSRSELLSMVNTDLSAEPEATRQVTRTTPIAVDDVVTVPLRLHRRKDGTVFPVETTLRFFTWGDRPVHLAANRDITERRQAEEALARSSHALQQVQEMAHLGSWELDVAARTVVASPEAHRIYGLRYGVLALEDVQRGVLPEYRPALDEALAGLVAHGRPYDVEFRVQRPTDGEIRDIHSVAEYDAARGVVAGYIQDITERKRAEEALRASEERYRSFFDLDITGDYLSTPDGTLLACNPAFAEMMGFASAEEALNSRATSLYATPGDRQAFLDLLTRERILRNYASRLVRQDGRPIDVVENVVGVFDDDGALRQLQGFLFDVTEQKRAQDALQEKQRILAESQRIAHLGSWVVDLHTRRVSWSDEMYRIFGVSPAEFEVTAGAFVRLVHPDDRAAMRKWFRACGAGEEPAGLEFRVVRPDGGLRWILGQGTVEYDAEGRPIRAVGTAQDITEHVRMEEEEEKLHLQLAQAQKMEYVGRLAGGVAHDFNNALQTMLLNLEEALDEAGDGTTLQENLLDIRTAALHSADLTRQLLAFARRQSVSPKVVDLNDAVAGMLKMLQRLIGEDIVLAWVPGRELWPVRVDPSQLDQILTNLTVNARDAISGVGHLTVETANVVIEDPVHTLHAYPTPGEYVQLTVTDDGRGMDEETLAYVFEPFFTTKEVGEGTGLGLATVYGIVKQNDGFVNVYSEPGHGTTFKVYLPRFQTETPAATTTEPAEEVRGGAETLLVVEDDPALLRASKAILTRLGYAVLAANRPLEAIRAAEEREGPIHLLITDVVMPEMNGRELVERLLVARPTLRYMYMSGYTADVIAQRGVLDDGVQFIPKPFDAKALARKVREVLDRS